MNTPTHLTNFPCMLPHVGKSYRTPLHKRVLVIGESHYLPKGAALHFNAEGWYHSNWSQLKEQEIGYISTAQIIQEAKNERYRNRSYGIFRETAGALDRSGLHLPSWEDAIEHCIFINYFQRPAEETGKSIRVQEIDVRVANEVLGLLIAEYAPEIIIVVSSLAGRYVREYLKDKGIPFIVTPHPSTSWWNRAAPKYGGLRGRDLFSKILKEQSWMAPK
jgi:hypothetical protein